MWKLPGRNWQNSIITQEAISVSIWEQMHVRNAINAKYNFWSISGQQSNTEHDQSRKPIRNRNGKAQVKINSSMAPKGALTGNDNVVIYYSVIYLLYTKAAVCITSKQTTPTPVVSRISAQGPHFESEYINEYY